MGMSVSITPEVIRRRSFAAVTLIAMFVSHVCSVILASSKCAISADAKEYRHAEAYSE